MALLLLYRLAKYAVGSTRCWKMKTKFVKNKINGLKRKTRIVLIDDDPSFTGLMSHVVTKNGMIAESYEKLEDVDASILDGADVLVVDYDLGMTTGLEIGKKLESLRYKKPVLLVSGDQRAFGSTWPSTIRNFAAKSLGPFGVFECIRELAPA